MFSDSLVVMSETVTSFAIGYVSVEYRVPSVVQPKATLVLDSNDWIDLGYRNIVFFRISIYAVEGILA